ncbi:mitochondrial import inner membrane translocase subunit Tim21 [Athalia rosae]|uniref:mitochondrial import inner membrane translocase subunit Tim21 n=1 Tax=Athalia rosae TaxID=37344 RepID=UPI002033AA29|nr:mitochondrial import inner membrane translocase subunit Tim21 [Athalia rosae]XP_012267663.2 mitochondrial import inner membrane translocase subunit Tim21 [Athalia rosae]XP_025602884.2 mitochondrial import inner membrane translocase subunit Tim21 [Athalia rosae]
MASTRVINCFLGRGIFGRRYLLMYNTSILPTSCHAHLPCNIAMVKSYSKVKTSEASVTNIDRKTTDQVQVGFAEVVKENTKSAWYLTVIVAGTVVTSALFFAIFRELFSSKSSNNIYTKALERCKQDTRVIDALGEPIKAYGEETRRGRRGHVSHTFYQKDGVPHVRMQFYIQGIRKRGTVHLDMREDQSGNFVYRYLFIQLEDMARNVIVLEDNRSLESQSLQTPAEIFPKVLV